MGAPPPPPPPADYDVVIVGAGPTGLALANLLGAAGVRTLLAERNPATVGEPRAVSLDDESLRLLQAIGVAEAVLRDVARGYGSVYLGPDRRPFLAVQPGEGSYGWPKRNAFRQPLLERCLRDALTRYHPNVSARFGAAYLGHEDRGEDGGVLVHLDGGDAACRYLVGADGGRSAIRRAIGATLQGSSFEEPWLIVDLRDTPDPFRETRVFADPRRPGLSLPGPHRTRRYEWRLLPGETVETMETEDAARRLLRAYGLDGDAPIDRIKVYTFQARVVDRWRRGRVFLAGDAAHLTPPFAGQGMNAGLRDAANLAWKLAAVLQGRLGAGLLDTYQQERRGHAWAMIRLAVAMGRVMAPRTRLGGALTRGFFRAAGLVPPVRDWFAQMRFKPRPRYEAGFFASGAAPAGTMLPQPTIEDAASGHDLRLDDVLGPGFAALAYGTDPGPMLARLDPSLLRRLDARLVGCLPRTLAFAPSPSAAGAALVRDATGALGAALRGQETLLLLRPDRYVALAVPNGMDANGALRTLVDGTGAAEQDIGLRQAA